MSDSGYIHEAGYPQCPKVNPEAQVAIYARRSSKEEGGRNMSKAEQAKYCKQVAGMFGFAPQNITLYEEPDGEKGDHYWKDSEGRNPSPWRPELTRMMGDVAAGKVEVVLCWRSDRLIRDNGVGDALAKEFRKHGVKLICNGKDMDLGSSSGLYQWSVEAANNRRWRDQISEDIKRDKYFKMSMGKFVRDPSCLGLRSKGKGSQAVEPRWDEIDLVNRIFTLYVKGENGSGPMGINAIAGRLMDEGVRVAVGAKGHKPKDPYRVHTSQIKSILTNCEYIGKFRFRHYEYDCPALLVSRDGEEPHTVVPVELYNAAQERLRLTAKPGKKSTNSEHLLTGIVICAFCGRPLFVHFERRVKNADGKARPVSKNFVCPHRQPPRYCKPYGMRMIQEEVLDGWIISELAPLLAAEIRDVQATAGQDAGRQELLRVQQEISKLKQRETQTLAEMVGVMAPDQIRNVASSLRAEREAMQRRADEIQARLGQEIDLPDLSAEAISQMPKSALKDALRRAVSWIAISKEGVIVLTRFSTYIAAKIVDIPRGTYRTRQTRLTVAPPSPDAALQCLSWLPSPEDFIKGRRFYGGKMVEQLTDAEILPGLFDVIPDHGEAADLEVSVERLDDESSN